MLTLSVVMDAVKRKQVPGALAGGSVVRGIVLHPKVAGASAARAPAWAAGWIQVRARVGRQRSVFLSPSLSSLKPTLMPSGENLRSPAEITALPSQGARGPLSSVPGRDCVQVTMQSASRDRVVQASPSKRGPGISGTSDVVRDAHARTALLVSIVDPVGVLSLSLRPMSLSRVPSLPPSSWLSLGSFLSFTQMRGFGHDRSTVRPRRVMLSEETAQAGVGNAWPGPQEAQDVTWSGPALTLGEVTGDQAEQLRGMWCGHKRCHQYQWLLAGRRVPTWARAS